MNRCKSQTQRVLVVYKDEVYDVTQFINRHPGGKQAIVDFTGQSIDNILFNPQYHKHGSSVVHTLAQFKVGIVGGQKSPPPIIDIKKKSQAAIQHQFPSKQAIIQQQQSTTPRSLAKIKIDSKTITQTAQSITSDSLILHQKPIITQQKISTPKSPRSQMDKQLVLQVSNPKSPSRLKSDQKPKILTSLSMNLEKDSRFHKQTSNKNNESIIINENAYIIKRSSAQDPHNQQKSLSISHLNNTSFSDGHVALNRSLSSNQFLTIPNAKEVQLQQRVKQQRMMLEERQKQIQKQKSIEPVERLTQSEILQKPKSTNLFYEQWKQQQNLSKILSTSTAIDSKEEIIIQNSLEEKKTKKTVNSFYQEWQSKQKQPTIVELEEESIQSPTHHRENVNNKGERSLSAFSSQSMLCEEDLDIQIPILKPKLLEFLNIKSQFSQDM